MCSVLIMSYDPTSSAAIERLAMYDKMREHNIDAVSFPRGMTPGDVVKLVKTGDGFGGVAGLTRTGYPIHAVGMQVQRTGLNEWYRIVLSVE